MNVLELEDVSITYQNTKEAVKHVSFAVPEGRIVAGRRCDIIGPDSVW
mgnify:CR=1 FL=1